MSYYTSTFYSLIQDRHNKYLPNIFLSLLYVEELNGFVINWTDYFSRFFSNSSGSLVLPIIDIKSSCLLIQMIFYLNPDGSSLPYHLF